MKLRQLTVSAIVAAAGLSSVATTALAQAKEQIISMSESLLRFS